MPAVITIDGPSGTGKGTLSLLLAEQLGWHYLDSGSLYRGLAWGLLQAHTDLEDAAAVAAALPHLHVQVIELAAGEGDRVVCNGKDITSSIRNEPVSMAASQISSQSAVRERLLELQREARREPGLITDGRDMGTVVFPDAEYKFYLDADPLERAKRRYNQLKQQGISVSLRNIEQDLAERDARDVKRALCPLKPAADAIIIDTSNLSIGEVLDKVKQHLPMFS